MVTAAAAAKKERQNAGDVEEQPQIVVPFPRASREIDRPFHDNTEQIGSAAVQVGPVEVPATGFYRGFLVEVVASGGDGSTTNAVAQEDAPFSVLDNIIITDTTGKNLVGPISGFDLYLINKWGGYGFATDPENDPDFADVDTDGDFTFMVWVPQEITAWDGLGSLPNQDASAAYGWQYQIAADTAIYSTNPADAGGDALPSVRVRATVYSWSQPPTTDLRGNPQQTTPPANGTTQKWTRQILAVESGDNTLQLKRVGNLIREIILVLRDDSSPRVRTTTEFPDPITLTVDGRDWHNNLRRNFLRRQMQQRWDQAPDTGVFVLDYIHDRDHHPGNEHRDLYIPTHPGTLMELEGSFGGAGQLTVLTCDVAPAAEIFDLEA